jgi:hypothetical protein
VLYLITLAIFLAWAVFAILKGRISWHAILSIYFIVLFVADYGDVICDYWFDFYTLPSHLLRDQDNQFHFGLILSDGFIFPVIAIVFCYYAARFNRPWLLSLAFAALLGVIELIFFGLGFMVYHRWHHLITPLISIFLLRLLAGKARRLIYSSPPISYRFRLLCAIYAICTWPDAFFSGILRLYQFKPILSRETVNDPLLAMTLATLMGAAAAASLPRVAQKYRLELFSGLGVCSGAAALWMHGAGLIQYNHWNDAATVARYILPYMLVWLYDRWESRYSRPIAIQ